MKKNYPTRFPAGMSRQVKFYWWQSYKVWRVAGKDFDEITTKCHKLCEKYHALHFEIL